MDRTIIAERLLDMAERLVTASFVLDPWSASDREQIEDVLEDDGIDYKKTGRGSELEVFLERNSMQASILLAYLNRQRIKFEEV